MTAGVKGNTDTLEYRDIMYRDTVSILKNIFN